jgi:VCBS repeat-containing protein
MTHKFTRDQYYEKGAAIFQRFRTALTIALSLLSTSSWAVVTYDGTDGVLANIFNSNSQQACTGCHSSALAGVDRNSATVGVDFNTYALATSIVADLNFDGFTNGDDRNAVRASIRVDQGTMPLDINTLGALPLNSTEKALIAQWITDGYPQNAAPEMTTSAATSVGKYSATLNGTVKENGANTTVSFKYDTNSPPTSFTKSVTSPSGSGGGTTADSISGSITSLSCGTLYYFRSVGTNSVGTVNGSILNFTTNACNVAPIITSTAGTSATEDVQYSYQVAVTDPDDSNNGTDFSFSLSNQPAGMNVSSTGLITWTPTEGVTTSGTVTVTVQDGGEDGAAADTENFTVSVTAVNDSPQITSTAGTSATEDAQYSYQVAVTDPDDSNNGTDLSFALTNEPSGMVVSSTGLITWTPVNGVTTSGTVTVTVTDGGEDSATGDTENFTVSVTAVNDPPTITSTAGTSATEDVQYSYQVAVTDVDDSNNGTDLSFSLSNQPTGMVVSSTGLITWTPSEGVTTSGVVTVTVQDGGENGAAADTENFTVSVTAVNDSPQITSTAGTLATEDIQYSYQVAVTDPDDTNNGTDLTFALSNEPSGMVVSSTGLITWTPTDGVTTSGSVTVTVNDGGEDSATGDSEIFTVAVTAVNDSPSITSSAGTSATEDVQYSYQVAVTDVDDSNNGTDLTFSLSNQPTGMVVSSTGLVTWTPLEGVTTSGLVTVTVQDGGEDGATSDSENFTVSVTAVNDAPQITSTPSTSATEDVQYSYQVSVSDPDDSNNGTDISFALSNQPSGMVVSSTGLVTWTPTNGVTTSGQVTVTVSDGGEDGAVAATQNWTVTVGGVNDAPIITSTAGTTATEDVLYSYQVAVTDPDDSNNGTDLTFSLVNEPTGMTVSSTGLIQWIPVEGQLSSGAVTVSVADGGENGALPDSEVFTVTVTPVNDSPQITSAPSTSAIEDNLYSYQVVTADPDDANNGTDLSFVLSNQPTGMTVNSTGLISWTPTNGVISSGEVTITVTDGGEDGAIAATQSWTVSVDGVNDPPVITSTATTTAIEDVLYQYQVLVTDPDDVNNGTDLTFSLTNAPVGMTVSSTGLVEWIPFEGQLTSDSVTVTVADGGESGALPDTETFTVTVTPVNDSPFIASAASTSATEDVEYRYQVVVIDPDDDNNGTDLTYVLTNAPSGMVVSNTGLITWTPSNGVTTSGEVTITVSDGGEDGAVSDAQNWTVTVDAVNDAPVISSTASTSAIEDILYSYQVQVTDPDDSNNGTDLSFSLTNAPTGMSVSTTGLVTWTPTEGQLTSGDVTLTVSDGGENNAQPDAETFTVLVTSVNDSPTISSTAVTSATEDTQYRYQVTVVDPDDTNDGSSLTFALSGEPTGMTVSSTGLITWTPEEGTFTSGQVTVIVADGGEDGASSDAQAWTVTVTTVNDSPVITSTAGTQATEDELYSYQLVVNDPDDSNNGTDLTFSLSGAPTGMTVSDTGLISWTPVEGQLSSGQVSISVSDGGEDGSVAAVEQFTVTVTPVDDAPTITSTAITMATEDVAYQYDVDATDPENSVLAFSLSTAPVGMSIDDASGVISWTPLEGVVLEAVTVLVSDGVNTDSQSFSVAVTPVNDPPVFTSSPVTVATEDIEYSYTLTASDVENDGLTFSLISGPSGMSLSSSNQLIWTATEGVLTEAVTVQVTDGEFDVTQSFSISVIAVNDGVSVTALSDQAVTELSTWQVSIVVSDPDDVNDGSSIRFQLI